jgi:riboflavin-specific deaminase-like protein
MSAAERGAGWTDERQRGGKAAPEAREPSESASPMSAAERREAREPSESASPISAADSMSAAERGACEIHRYRRDDVPLTDDDLIALYDTDRARSWLRVNLASSLDGAVTAADGFSAGLSGEADKRVFGILRMLCDALLVGAGTLRHERYGPVRLDAARREWRRAHGRAEYPTLVVISRSLDLDPEQPAFTEAPVRPIVLTTDMSAPQRREALSAVAHVLVYGETDVDLAAALDVLRLMGYRDVLCEGGPHVLGALTAADLVDELCITFAPLLVGPGPGRITSGGPPSEPRGLALRHVLGAGGTLLLRYTRR